MKPTIHDFFKEVEDPRKWRNVQHKLLDIIVISILAVICGAEGWEEIELFGKSKEGFLKEFLELPKGIKSSKIPAEKYFGVLDLYLYLRQIRNWKGGI